MFFLCINCVCCIKCIEYKHIGSYFRCVVKIIWTSLYCTRTYLMSQVKLCFGYQCYWKPSNIRTLLCILFISTKSWKFRPVLCIMTWVLLKLRRVLFLRKSEFPWLHGVAIPAVAVTTSGDLDWQAEWSLNIANLSTQSLAWMKYKKIGNFNSKAFLALLNTDAEYLVCILFPTYWRWYVDTTQLLSQLA